MPFIQRNTLLSNAPPCKVGVASINKMAGLQQVIKRSQRMATKLEEILKAKMMYYKRKNLASIAKNCKSYTWMVNLTLVSL